MPDDFNEFDELDAAEERIAAREGVNIWGRPLKTEDISWRPHPEAVQPPQSVNSVEAIKTAKKEKTMDRYTARDLGMRWDAPPGLIEAAIARFNTGGPKALAAEYKVPIPKMWVLGTKLRAKGLIEKMPMGRRAHRHETPAADPTRKPARSKPQAQSLETKIIGETVTQEESLDGVQSIAIEKVLELRIRIQVEVAEK